jgi:hypothetical protein
MKEATLKRKQEEEKQRKEEAARGQKKMGDFQ